MKIKHLISSLLLSASLVTAGALFASQERIEKAEATVWKQNPTIYFVASNNWNSASATFKMNYYDNATYKGVVTATNTGKKKDNRTIYSFTVTDGSWVSAVQFLRMNSTGSTQWNYSGTFDISDNYDTKANDGTNTLYMTSSFATYDNWSTSSSGVSWEKYSEDTVTYTVTKYKVLDSGSPVSIESETVAAGTTYPVPANRYEAGYTFDGWYTTSACTTKYTAKAINANTGIYAKYTSHAAWTGTVNVDLRDTWYDAAANYAIYFMNKSYSPEVGGWSTYVTGTAANVRLVTIPYSLPFEPIQMTLVRYNSTYTKSNWEAKQWPTDGNMWGQTPDISVTDIIRVGTTVEDGKNLAYLGYPKVARWNPSASDIFLNTVKLNGSNHAEYYSTSVVLAQNQEFKIQIAPYESGDYYGNYTTHDSLKSSFSGGGSSNIKCLVAGTYAFYFDSALNSTYITKVEIAEADEWAQYFLSHVGCDATGASLPSGWSSCAAEYAKLSDPAKDIVYGASSKEDGNYVEQAVARYDVAVKNHPSLTRFIVNSGDTPRASSYMTPMSIFNKVDSSAVVISTVVVGVAAIAVGGYFLLRKKNEN